MMPEIAGWDGFYVIAGSAAGALIGLQFVVMTLFSNRPPAAHGESAGAAYATPTIVHFGTVLFLAALLHAPWRTVEVAAMIWGAVGFIGVVYALVTALRMSRQPAYRPAFEDWIFHAALPFAAYAGLAVSAIAAPTHTRESLFGVAGATLALLFTGIHNAWDAAAYHVLVMKSGKTPDERRDGPAG